MPRLRIAIALCAALVFAPSVPAVAAPVIATLVPATITELPRAANPPGVEALRAVACMTPSWCVAVGYSGSPFWPPLTSTAYVVPITDGTPQQPVVVAGVVQLSSVACPTAHYCLATGIGAAPVARRRGRECGWSGRHRR